MFLCIRVSLLATKSKRLSVAYFVVVSEKVMLEGDVDGAFRETILQDFSEAWIHFLNCFVYVIRVVVRAQTIAATLYQSI